MQMRRTPGLFDLLHCMTLCWEMMATCALEVPNAYVREINKRV